MAPLAATSALAPRIRTGTTVTAVSRQGVDKTRTVGREGRPYLVRTSTTDGDVEEVLASAVIDASGTWGRENPLGVSGLPARGEDAAARWIAPALPDVLGRDRDRFAGKQVLVVGVGHSAANTLLALVRLREQETDTTITWAVRGRSPPGSTAADYPLVAPSVATSTRRSAPGASVSTRRSPSRRSRHRTIRPAG